MTAHLVLLLAFSVVSAAASTVEAQGTSTPSPSSWVAIPSNATVTINGNIFEAECGANSQAIQQNGQVVRFEMIQGNTWAEDAWDSERTELDGYKQMLIPGTPYWAAWSLYLEPGPWSTSDWLVLEQMPGLWGHLILKGTHTLSFIVSNVPLARISVSQGVWYNFVEKYVVGPTGSVASWVNGKQVANYTGRIGSGGSYYPKLGIYRGNRTAAGAPVRESIGARYANFKFGTTDLSALIANPDPLPAYVSWP
jgi:hypothetical protein